jgi:hypothetical protein
VAVIDGVGPAQDVVAEQLEGQRSLSTERLRERGKTLRCEWLLRGRASTASDFWSP